MIKDDSDGKKLIFFVVPSMQGGGAERVANILMTHIDRDRFCIKLILFNKTGEYLGDIPDDIETVDLQKKGRWDFLLLIFKLRKLLRQDNPHAVISFIHYANIITVFANKLAHGKSKTIICEHNYFKEYIKNQRFSLIKRYLIRVAYNMADKVISISNKMTDGLNSFLKIPRHKIETIYNPIDIDYIVSRSTEDIDHPLFKDTDDKLHTICGMGRLTEQKRFDVLINAVALLKGKLPLRLIIIGQGPLLNDLKVLARNLSIDDHVHFIGFQINPFAWLRKADLFVLSSDYEGFPMVLLEAMACKVPVVSTDCPSGPSEIIINGNTGILVPAGNEVAISQAIDEILSNHSLADGFRERGYESIMKFSAQNITEQYEKVILCYKN